MNGCGGGLVMMVLSRRRRAALAVHPAGITASIMLFLPDRHAMFHFVDNKPAGIEGFAAVRGTDTDPHGHIAHSQRADAMNAQGMLHREAPQGVGDDAFAFLHRKFLKRFILQTSNLLSLILI